MELKAATVTVGKARLIEDVSLKLAPGKLTVILGANGAGKSTTLAVLAGDLRPTRGDALLDGRPVAAYTPRALATRRAVVLQHAPMNFALCVHEVVALSRPRGAEVGAFSSKVDAGLRRENTTKQRTRAPLRFSRSGKGSSHACDEIEERALCALELLPLAGRDYGTLSGGERQRVQIARALAQLWHHASPGQPGFLLMDEPTAHLDLKHQIIALEVAHAFTQAGGAALCILHDIGLAREFADEIVLMKRGRIAARGPAGALLTAPAIADIYDIPDERARRLAVA